MPSPLKVAMPEFSPSMKRGLKEARRIRKLAGSLGGLDERRIERLNELLKPYSDAYTFSMKRGLKVHIVSSFASKNSRTLFAIVCTSSIAISTDKIDPSFALYSRSRSWRLG